jgi:lipopolysaccharide transport system permease protein
MTTTGGTMRPKRILPGNPSPEGAVEPRDEHTVLERSSTDDNGVHAWFRLIAQHRDLLFMIAWREIRVKYKQSIMGWMWAILMPALIVSAGIMVKYVVASLSDAPLRGEDVVSVAVRSVPWAFFVASVRFGSVSLVSNANLVTKIYMPRVIFPLAAVLSQLFDLCVAGIVLAVVLMVIGVPLTVHLLWLPVLLALMIGLVAGFAILLSAAGLFFRDVKYIVEVVITFAIFFTPVFYDVQMFGRWANVLLANPVAPILEGIGAVLLGHAIPYPGWLLYSAAFATGGCALAVHLFRRMEPYFAESV